MPVDTYWNLAPVVQKVEGTIRWIKLYPVDNAIGFPNTYPLVINPVDSAIQLLNNWGLVNNFRGVFFETIFLPSQEIFSEKCLLHIRKIKRLHKDDKVRLKVLN